MVTENCPVSPGRAMSIEDVEKSAGASVSPAVPALHAGNRYVVRPPPLTPAPCASYSARFSSSCTRPANHEGRCTDAYENSWHDPRDPPIPTPWPLKDPAPDSARDTDVREPRHAGTPAFDDLVVKVVRGALVRQPDGQFVHKSPEELRALGLLPPKPTTLGLDLGHEGPCAPPPGRNIPADCVLPNDPFQRKKIPAAAVLDYFDAAIVEIAKALQAGNDEHNPGEPLHWARGKSPDQDHCIIRHFLERGTIYVDRNGVPVRHSTSLAIRALMLLQLELEAAGAPMSRGSRPAKVL